MNTTNISRGALIAGASAVLLLIFMFFSWYGVESVTTGGIETDFSDLGGLGGVPDTAVSAWGAFSFIDILLFLCIVGIVGLVILEMTGAGINLPVPAGTVMAGLGGLAFILILFRLIITPEPDIPDFGFGVDVDFDVSRKIGVFLGLLASIGMAVGGFLAMREEGASFGDIGTGTGAGTTGAAPPPGAPPQAPPPPPAGGSQAPPPPPPSGP